MRRIAAMMISCLMIVILAACNGNTDSNGSRNGDSNGNGSQNGSDPDISYALKVAQGEGRRVVLRLTVPDMKDQYVVGSGGPGDAEYAWYIGLSENFSAQISSPHGLEQERTMKPDEMTCYLMYKYNNANAPYQLSVDGKDFVASIWIPDVCEYDFSTFDQFNVSAKRSDGYNSGSQEFEKSDVVKTLAEVGDARLENAPGADALKPVDSNLKLSVKDGAGGAAVFVLEDKGSVPFVRLNDVFELSWEISSYASDPTSGDSRQIHSVRIRSPRIEKYGEEFGYNDYYSKINPNLRKAILPYSIDLRKSSVDVYANDGSQVNAAITVSEDGTVFTVTVEGMKDQVDQCDRFYVFCRLVKSESSSDAAFANAAFGAEVKQ